MGRPKGSKNKSTEEVTKDVEVNKKTVETKVNEVSETQMTKEDMLEMAQEMAKKMFAELVAEQELAKETAKPDIKTKSRLTSIDPSTKVIIRNNAYSRLGWYDAKGRTGANLTFNEFGDEDVVSVEELRDINRLTNLVKNGTIVIVDIYGDECTLKEVIVDGLRLESLYYGDGISPNEIVEILTSDVGYTKLNELLNNSNQIGEAILEIAHMLNKQGKIKETYKRDALNLKYKGFGYKF